MNLKERYDKASEKEQNALDNLYMESYMMTMQREKFDELDNETFEVMLMSRAKEIQKHIKFMKRIKYMTMFNLALAIGVGIFIGAKFL